MEASTLVAGSSRWTRFPQAFTPAEWRRAGAMGAFVLALHIVGLFLLFARVAPEHYSLGKSGAFSVGVGFDTATEVALLVHAVGAAGAGLPFYAILALPILFAAGMSLLDTLDGTSMNFAYGWAFLKPVRKVYYNITITGLSVAVALVIGTIEILGLIRKPTSPADSGTTSRTSTSNTPASSSSACSCSPG
jgi:HoxN/HupN/NixA family high-affinity nickel-transporter